jgi:AcrR family transcriptional regulator
MSKREETKKKNRAKILGSALAVFSEKGLDGANIRDIIRDSELSPGTFYNYFESKEEVYYSLLDDIIANIRIEARNSWKKSSEGGLDSIAQSFESFLNIFVSHPDYLKFFERNQHHVRELRYNGKLDGILLDLENDFNEAIKNGRFPPFPVKLITLTLFGTVFEILGEMVRNPNTFNITETANYLSKFFRGGVIQLGNFNKKK